MIEPVCPIYRVGEIKYYQSEQDELAPYYHIRKTGGVWMC